MDDADRAETVLAVELRHRHAGLGLLDEPDDPLGPESTSMPVLGG